MQRVRLRAAAAGRAAVRADAAPQVQQRPQAPEGQGAQDVRPRQQDHHYTFTITPTLSQSVKLGDHTVLIPANVICDPATTAYGVGEWDKSCALARSPITFRAITGTRHGYAAIEFEPDARFAPAADNQPSRWVTLTLRDAKKLDDKKGYIRSSGGTPTPNRTADRATTRVRGSTRPRPTRRFRRGPTSTGIQSPAA